MAAIFSSKLLPTGGGTARVEGLEEDVGAVGETPGAGELETGLEPRSDSALLFSISDRSASVFTPSNSTFSSSGVLTFDPPELMFKRIDCLMSRGAPRFLS